MTDEIEEAASPPQVSAISSQPPTQPVTLPVELWRSVLLLQLGECWDDVRNIDSLVWQIPAGIGAILGLILSGLGPQVVKGRPSPLDVAAMFAVVLISYSLIVALHKNRKFQVSRNIYMKSIYKELLTNQCVPGDATVPVTLKPHDYEMTELPGFVARYTNDLVQEAHADSSQLASHIASFKRRLFKWSAYQTMFRVSILVLTGELFLALWLFIRFIWLG